MTVAEHSGLPPIDSQPSDMAGMASVPVPRAALPFFDFATALRRNGFVIAADQTQLFITATGLLGPRRMSDIYHAARATFAPPVERHAEFDALFRRIFLGQSIAAPSAADVDDEDELQAFDESDDVFETPQAEDINEAGEQASVTENLSSRAFVEVDESDALRRFRRTAPSRLPQRKTLRYGSARQGTRWDMRRSLRDAVKRDGEVLNIPRLQRKSRQRRILLMVDISGSMKAHTDSSLRFAHTLAALAGQLEVFTLGTRLTRVTRALHRRNQQQALEAAANVVADWDGGTRLGDAIEVFLNVPRFAGFARSALVVIVSDGLERGDHSALTNSVSRLSRLCWRIEWLTPLAADTGYTPETEALSAILPYIDRIGDGSSAASIATHLLNLSRGAE